MRTRFNGRLEPETYHDSISLIVHAFWVNAFGAVSLTPSPGYGMRLSHGHVTIVAAVAVSVTIAACGSSSPTGPSAASLAHVFDSAGRVDGSVRAAIERLLALSADEGGRPTPVTVTKDGGTLTMLMLAVEAYDTSTTGSGLATDSTLFLLGYTSDYSKYIVVGQKTTTGNPDFLPPQGIRVRTSDLAQLRAAMRNEPRNRSMAASPVPATLSFADFVQGNAVVLADTIAFTGSTVATSGSCVWQHVTLAIPGFQVDSTTACKPIALAASFALHFPSQTGIDASFQHMSVSPAVTVHGPRIVSHL